MKFDGDGAFPVLIGELHKDPAWRLFGFCRFRDAGSGFEGISRAGFRARNDRLGRTTVVLAVAIVLFAQLSPAFSAPQDRLI
jgi:hypothetical protein